MQLRKGVVLAAPKSGSGKTLITCAMIEALKEKEVPICSLKNALCFSEQTKLGSI